MNKEGVEYSMTQWFPRLCEFDHHGWHATPTSGGEFHGIWGDYDVTLHLPERYVVAPQGCGRLPKNRPWPDGTPGR